MQMLFEPFVNNLDILLVGVSASLWLYMLPL